MKRQLLARAMRDPRARRRWRNRTQRAGGLDDRPIGDRNGVDAHVGWRASAALRVDGGLPDRAVANAHPAVSRSVTERQPGRSLHRGTHRGADDLRPAHGSSGRRRIERARWTTMWSRPPSGRMNSRARSHEVQAARTASRCERSAPSESISVGRHPCDGCDRARLPTNLAPVRGEKLPRSSQDRRQLGKWSRGQRLGHLRVGRNHEPRSPPADTCRTAPRRESCRSRRRRAPGSRRRSPR